MITQQSPVSCAAACVSLSPLVGNKDEKNKHMTLLLIDRTHGVFPPEK